jgi:hypothetical protein
MSRKALKLAEINQAVNFDEPIGADHPFFTDFSEVRGDFEDRKVYDNLNVDISEEGLTFDPRLNSRSKATLFLGGMRGSGKTSELRKYAQKLHRPECFFCVTCNMDDELDLNNLEYMDIVVFQLEKLTAALEAQDIRINEGAMKSLEKWFSDTVKTVNNAIRMEGGAEIAVEAKAGFWSILSVFASLKAGMKGSQERATSVRTALRNRFDDFASKFNEYVEEANLAIRAKNLGREVLFIVDGLEKTMTAEMRRKVVIDESNRIRQINAYTLFTLPIELMKERQRLLSFAEVETFPFVKLREKDGTVCSEAYDKFREFVHKRIAHSLFASQEVVDTAIRYSGGSPRELLRILKQAKINVPVGGGQIDQAALDKALRRLANQTAQYITEAQWKIVKTVAQRQQVDWDSNVQELLEQIILMEYNDGNYKRPNPILELSDAYSQHIEAPA